MNKYKIEEWFMNVCLGWIMLVVLVLVSKLAFDLWTAPNIFIKKEEAVAPVGNTDEVCVKWLFQSNLDGAKKRICGR